MFDRVLNFIAFLPTLMRLGWMLTDEGWNVEHFNGGFKATLSTTEQPKT